VLLEPKLLNAGAELTLLANDGFEDGFKLFEPALKVNDEPVPVVAEAVVDPNEDGTFAAGTGVVLLKAKEVVLDVPLAGFTSLSVLPMVDVCDPNANPTLASVAPLSAFFDGTDPNAVALSEEFFLFFFSPFVSEVETEAFMLNWKPPPLLSSLDGLFLSLGRFGIFVAGGSCPGALPKENEVVAI